MLLLPQERESTGEMTEKQFQSHIVHFAKTRGWLVYHTHDSRRSEPGFPDLVLVRGRVLFRELKTDKGKISPAQKEWAASLEQAESDYKLWRPSMMTDIYKELL